MPRADHWSLRVPIRMRRPPATLEALGRSPLMEARRAHSTRIERVPLVPAATSPLVILAGRPAAEWASNAWAGGVEAFRLIGFTINNNGRLVIRESGHARYYELCSGARN